MPTQMLLDDSQLPGVAAFLAHAMDDDPAYAYLMPDPATRRRGLRDYFARSLRTHVPHRCTHIALDGNVAIGTVTVRPPGGIRISTLTMLRRGLIPFAVAHGMAAVQRLFALKDAYDRLEARLSAGRPHWWVHMMAVDPPKHGRGMGTALLASALAVTADAHGNAELPVLLTTHNERNVTFYRRAGFEVIDVQELALEGAAPYPVWGMRRLALRSR
jgi:GNAT superfamily N-acetyltransferase